MQRKTGEIERERESERANGAKDRVLFLLCPGRRRIWVKERQFGPSSSIHIAVGKERKELWLLLTRRRVFVNDVYQLRKEGGEEDVARSLADGGKISASLISRNSCLAHLPFVDGQSYSSLIGWRHPAFSFFLFFPKNVAGFDAYFKALRPKTAKVCGSVGGSANNGGPAGGNNGAGGVGLGGYGENQYYRNAVKGARIFNCRNPWFRQFWEQHFKCRFNSSSGPPASNGSSQPECRGGDKLSYYEQEGLVPFVGKFSMRPKSQTYHHTRNRKLDRHGGKTLWRNSTDPTEQQNFWAANECQHSLHPSTLSISLSSALHTQLLPSQNLNPFSSQHLLLLHTQLAWKAESKVHPRGYSNISFTASAILLINISTHHCIYIECNNGMARNIINKVAPFAHETRRLNCRGIGCCPSLAGGNRAGRYALARAAITLVTNSPE